MREAIVVNPLDPDTRVLEQLFHHYPIITQAVLSTSGDPDGWKVLQMRTEHRKGICVIRF